MINKEHKDTLITAWMYFAGAFILQLFGESSHGTNQIFLYVVAGIFYLVFLIMFTTYDFDFWHKPVGRK